MGTEIVDEEKVLEIDGGDGYVNVHLKTEE